MTFRKAQSFGNLSGKQKETTGYSMKQRRSELEAISGPSTRVVLNDIPMPEQMTRHFGPDSEVC
jgi:hypothetical protein